MIELIIWLLFLLLLPKLISYVLKNMKFKSNNKQDKESNTVSTVPEFERKTLLTDYERKFYNILQTLNNEEYIVIPQICLVSVVKKKIKTKYNTDLYRIIDFAIFNKYLTQLLLLIELNDQTHNQYNRKDRDLKVKKICLDANITLMNFYSSYPNEPDYVLKRILTELKKDDFPTLES